MWEKPRFCCIPARCSVVKKIGFWDVDKRGTSSVNFGAPFSVCIHRNSLMKIVCMRVQSIASKPWKKYLTYVYFVIGQHSIRWRKFEFHHNFLYTVFFLNIAHFKRSFYAISLIRTTFCWFFFHLHFIKKFSTIRRHFITCNFSS